MELEQCCKLASGYFEISEFHLSCPSGSSYAADSVVPQSFSLLIHSGLCLESQLLLSAAAKQNFGLWIEVCPISRRRDHLGMRSFDRLLVLLPWI